jgi:hypothetical protein
MRPAARIKRGVEWQEPSANTDIVLVFVDESIILSMLVFVQVISHRGLPFNPTQTDIINPHSPARHTPQNAPRFIKHRRRTHTHVTFCPGLGGAQFCCPYRSPFMHSLFSFLPRSKQNLRQWKKGKSLSSCGKKYNHHARTPTDSLTDWLTEGMLTRRTLCNFPGRGRGKYAWEPVYLGADTWLWGMRACAVCNCEQTRLQPEFTAICLEASGAECSGFTCQRGQIVQNCALCPTKKKR